MSTVTLAVITFVCLAALALLAVRLGAHLFDAWLDRRLFGAWDLDLRERVDAFDPDATPIADEAMAAVLRRAEWVAAEGAALMRGGGEG